MVEGNVYPGNAVSDFRNRIVILGVICSLTRVIAGQDQYFPDQRTEAG